MYFTQFLNKVLNKISVYIIFSPLTPHLILIIYLLPIVGILNHSNT